MGHNHPDEYATVPCLLCNQTDTKLITKRGQFGLPTYVSICRNDGLVYLTPRWTKAQYDHFYSTDYDNYYRPSIFSTEPDEQKHVNIRTIWSRLSGPSPTDVLDIGAGMGWSLQFIKNQVEKTVSLSAIEPSEHCVSNLETQIGAELLANDVDSNWDEANQNRYDLVIMRHVLEHFLNPLEILKKVNRVLSPGGIVYIAVPDMMSPKGSLNNHWFRVVHTYYFSKQTLAGIAEQAGLRLLDLQSTNSELWGIFEKNGTSGSNHQPTGMESVYAEQTKLLAAYRKEHFVSETIATIKGKVRQMRQRR